MTLSFSIQVIFEVLAIIFIAWGIWNEDQLIELEKVLKQYIHKKGVRFVCRIKTIVSRLTQTVITNVMR